MRTIAASSKKNNTDILWYVVKTYSGKELLLKSVLQKYMVEEGNILDFYCPIHTTHSEFYNYDDGRNDAPKVIKSKKFDDVKTKIEYRPLFAGLVFVKATEKALFDFLETYFPAGSILYNAIISEDGRCRPLVIPEDEFQHMKIFNESFKEEPLILHRSFEQYAFNHKTGKANDAVVVLDGPLKGKVGYIVRMGKNRSKGFAFEIRNPFGTGNITVGVSDIWNFHVARLHNANLDETTLATTKSRAFDLLVGLCQGAGFDDKVILDNVYAIIDHLVENNSLRDLCEELVERGNKVKEDTEQEGSYDRLSRSLRELSDSNLTLLLNLVRYERKFPGYVRDTFHEFVIRPFLTPTSGIENTINKPYAVIRHDNFVELIKKISLPERTYYPQTKDVVNEKVHYYAHVGIKHTTGGYLFFTNWDEFLSKYFLTGGTARKWIVSGKQTYDESTIVNDTIDTKGEQNSFYNYAKPLYKVLTGLDTVFAVKDLSISTKTLNAMVIELNTSEKGSIDELLADESVKHSIDKLINTSLDICTTISAETHLKMWRGYLNTVWLHK